MSRDSRANGDMSFSWNGMGGMMPSYVRFPTLDLTLGISERDGVASLARLLEVTNGCL